MSSAINQKAYLQKYLSGPSSDKKKKKKKVSKGKGFKIIDDDIDLTKLRPLEGDELDILGEGEDAPQIAGIIDERPEEIKKLEQFKSSSKWRVITKDDGFSSKIQIEEIQKDIKEVRKDNELIFGKMYSDSEDEQKNDSDVSPPRKQSSLTAVSKPQSHSDSDVSPPRKNNKRQSSPSTSGRHNEKHSKSRKTESKPQNRSDSDFSPPRKNDKNYDSPRKKPDLRDRKRQYSPSTTRSHDERHSKSRKTVSKPQSHSDSDVSPPRKNNKRQSSPSTSRRHEQKHTESSKTVPKPQRHSDSDFSLPRKNNKNYDSPRRKPDPRDNKRQSSPSTSRRHEEKHTESRKTVSKPQSHSDSDFSPPRKKEIGRRKSSDSDQSPPRKNRDSRDNKRQSNRSKSRWNDEDDRRDDRTKPNSDSPPPTNKKMAARTLEGKMAGLQDARQLREENEAFRKRQDEAFNKMADDVSGRNAQVVSRKTKRETSEERRKQIEKAERQKELDEKYKKWGKGLKQLEDREARTQEYLHESSKPLARHKNDRDLESSLKQIERDGDPMLQYIKERKRERGELPPEKPKYKGNFPPNRFNIRPGYRWDGVDRSNGYEKKYFDSQSKRRAQEEEAYKWSTEDL